MRKTIFLLLPVFLAIRYVSASPVSIDTRVTEDGQIEIIYALTSSDQSNTFPVFSINFTGEISGKKPFDLKTLEGAGKTGLILGEGTYTSFWNAVKDRKDPVATKISAEEEEVTDEANYLCLDLKKYKMRYQNDAPNVKKSTCKTKELWLRRIEPGTFMMGSPDGELGKDNDETQHEVTLTKAFYIGIFETTQKQFKTITGYNESCFRGGTKPAETVQFCMLRGSELGCEWPDSHKVDKETEYMNRKYEYVNGPTFFYSLRQKTGGLLIFDLPTEAQWEYACRAGTTTALNSGKNLTDTYKCPNMDEVGRYSRNGGIKNKKAYGPVKVGSYLPNAWGLYDMHGNVWEWCLDRYQEDLGSDAVIDPVGPKTWEGVIRGGCWAKIARFSRSADRVKRDYYSLPLDYYNGFRVVLVP